MKKSTRTALWGVGASVVLLATGVALAGGTDEKDEAPEIKTTVAASVVKGAIDAATKAKAGSISSVEVESEGGKTSVEVKIAGTDGKAYEVSVDAASGKVASVEADDDDDKGEGNQKGEDETK